MPTVFKHTQNVTYLETARKMSQYFLDHLPADGVVPWDFNAPTDPPRPADSSAAMIAASGLILLSQGELALSPANTTGSEFYTSAAIQVRLVPLIHLAVPYIPCPCLSSKGVPSVSHLISSFPL